MAQVKHMKKELILRAENYQLKFFPSVVNNYREVIIEKEKKLTNSIKLLINNKKRDFTSVLDKISVLNPINTLKRGYSVSQIEEKRIDSIDEVEINKDMITIFRDGKVVSVVKEKIYEKSVD